MKSFFEEYGFVILSAIVVVSLIAMVDPVSEKISSGLSGVVDSFTTSVNSQLNPEDS